jgi:chromosomal replication initiation ATPase DnaA
MKRKIFKLYAREISAQFDIDEQLLFIKTKVREVVDARYLLYYMCYLRGMKPITIETYMAEMGYVISHPTILYGISRMDKRALNDPDYERLINKLMKKNAEY